MSMKPVDLMKLLDSEYEFDSKIERTEYANMLVTGIVVDTDDPLQNGRLRIFCPLLNDDPAKLHHLPWAVYISPLSGVISNADYSRGTGKYPEKTKGAVAYGWWGIPEQGAKVLVGCIEGDERRRFWIGCIPEHQETHTLFHGRYDWSGDGGEPDGPLSSTGDPIEPLYTNAGKAFNEDRKSREWKTRQAEYQATAVDIDEHDAPNDSKTTYLDEQFAQISEAETDEWVKPIVGAHGYDWSGNKAVGSHKASRVFGFSTPGGHAFSFDDRAFNSRIRIRSATGHQIILDDTNERIYLSSNEGASWIELDSNGNIDVFSERRISVHAEKDINFTTDESFRVKAKKGIYMYAGDTEGQEPLDEGSPEDGEIRMHSTGDTHLMIEKNLRTLVEDDWLTEVGGNSCMSIAKKFNLQVGDEINIIVNNGDYNVAVDGNYNHHASVNTSIFSGNDNIIQAVNNTELFSYSGKMDIGAQLNLSIKSYEDDINLEAIEGNIVMSSNDGENYLMMMDDGMALFSEKGTALYSKEHVDTIVGPGLGVSVEQDTSSEVGGGDGLDGTDEGGDGGGSGQSTTPKSMTKKLNVTHNGNPVSSGCIDIPELLKVSFDGDGNAKWGIPNDFTYNLSSSAVNNSLLEVNDALNTFEEKFNKLSYTVQDRLTKFVDSWGLPSLDFTIPAFELPHLSFDLGFPGIELPQLDFPMCVNFTNFVDVQPFNIMPHGSFVSVNAYMGGWSMHTIKDWAKSTKGNFDKSLGSFAAIPDAVKNNFENVLSILASNVENIAFALDNLIDINVYDNATMIDAYYEHSIEFMGLLIQYNTMVDLHNGTNIDQIPFIHDLINAVERHNRQMDKLNGMIQADPSIVNGYDYSDLTEASNNYKDYANKIRDGI